ncbi:MAG: ABC transporter substrate-binding protein [Actinobacteria bacterium]|nr:ABC transporter substrate-binding protein [Actinomycetota bacterium]
MTRTRVSILAIGLAAAVAAGAAGASPAADPGLTASSILIGGTAPLSGEASSAAAVARGAEAYFKYVNARGGVNGRRITYKYVDDGYDPGRTVQAVRQLVQQDRVFALFNTLGTANNLAIRDFLNSEKVPQLFVASGYTAWGSDARRYPWTIGYIPSYLSEGTVYGRHLVKTKPGAKIGVLYQNDDYGKDLLNGLRKGLGPKAGQIVKAVAYDPTSTNVDSQVAELKGTGANTFVVFAFGKFAIQAFIQANRLGWRPQIYVNAVSASSNLLALATQTSSKKTTTGAISIAFAKDPADPSWAGDPGIKLFEQIMKKYVPGGNLKDGYYSAGMASAFTLVDTLKKAGKNLTRQTVLKASANLNEANNPFLLPGIVVKTGPSDRFPVEQMQLERWSGTRWTRFGGLVTAKS